MERKSKGRRPKGKESRKAVTFRLQPSTIERIKDLASGMEMSQSDVIERLVDDCY